MIAHSPAWHNWWSGPKLVGWSSPSAPVSARVRPAMVQWVLPSRTFCVMRRRGCSVVPPGDLANDTLEELARLFKVHGCSRSTETLKITRDDVDSPQLWAVAEVQEALTTLADLVDESGLAGPDRCAVATLTALDRQPAWRPTTVVTAQAVCPAGYGC